MNLRDLIKEVERLREEIKSCINGCMLGDNQNCSLCSGREDILQGIKQTVEAVNCIDFKAFTDEQDEKDWQKLKRLLGVK